MDTGFRTPWTELFRRGEADRDVRLMAARGELAPRPAEQLALLVLLVDDADAAVATAARATLDALPGPGLRALLARPDVPAEIRTFFEARGVQGEGSAAEPSAPLIDLSGSPESGAAGAGTTDADAAAAGDQGDDANDDQPRPGALQRIAAMTVPQRMAAAMKGTREERSILIRDSNKLVSLAVLSSPKITEMEIESIARMTNVTEEVPRTIAASRGWVKNYTICAALVKNPKTPLGISMNLLPRLNDRDMKALSTDRNVPEVLRATARKKVVQNRG